MKTDLFDFDLPDTYIALRPASPRDSARMLVVRPVRAEGRKRPRPAGFSESRRSARRQRHARHSAQLSGRRIGRETEPKIDVTLIKRLDGARWQALARPAKKADRG